MTQLLLHNSKDSTIVVDAVISPDPRPIILHLQLLYDEYDGLYGSTEPQRRHQW